MRKNDLAILCLMLVVGIMLPGCRNASSSQAEDKAESANSSVISAESGSGGRIFRLYGRVFAGSPGQSGSGRLGK